MAPTTRLERKAEDLEKEYHNASIAARIMMQSQARLTQILSKHANSAVASLTSMVQDIANANAKTNTALKQQEMGMAKEKLTLAKRTHGVDALDLQDKDRKVNKNDDRIRELTGRIGPRTTAENSELNSRAVSRLRLINDAKLSADKERKSRNEMDKLNTQIKTSETELKNIKLTALATTVNSLIDGMQKLVSAINKTQQQFGLAAGQAAKLKVDNIVSSFNSYVESAKSLLSGKPEFGVSAEMIEGAQAAYQNEFGGILTSDAATDLAKQARTMGVTAEQLTKARRVFTALSLGNVVEAKKSQDKFIAEFEKKGLTPKEAMEFIGKNSELIARNGGRFAQSFIRAAIEAKKIGVDLAKVSQFGDSVINNFEGFLEGQAELAAMGFNFDSSRLAQLAESNDTGALFEELKSELAAQGKNLTTLRRSEQLALSNAFGMGIEEFQRMAASGGKTPMGDTKSPEQLQVEANGSLASIVVGMDLLSTVLGNFLGLIALSSAITAGATTLMAAAISPMAAALLGLAGAVVGIVAALAALAAAIAFWKSGSKDVEEGKRKIAAGEKGGADQLIKGRAKQGASLAGGIVAGALLIGSGVGIPAGLAVIGASVAAGGLVGAGIGENEAAVPKGNDVISQSGYGARSLVTPSEVIALNNKDNIIAYADDLDGTKKLPYGYIANTLIRGEGQMLAGVKPTPTDAKTTAAAPIVKVDLSRLEAKLDNVIRAINSMEISMDGTKVGKVIATAEGRAKIFAPVSALRT